MAVPISKKKFSVFLLFVSNYLQKVRILAIAEWAVRHLQTTILTWDIFFILTIFYFIRTREPEPSRSIDSTYFARNVIFVSVTNFSIFFGEHATEHRDISFDRIQFVAATQMRIYLNSIISIFPHIRDIWCIFSYNCLDRRSPRGPNSKIATSCIVLSGFFDDMFRNRSCAWQNFAVFLSNFFLHSLTPPIRSFRKFSSGTTIWFCAWPSCSKCENR